MKKTTKRTLIELAIFLIVTGAVIYGVIVAMRYEEAQSIEKYNVCKEKTGDIEWCFNEFRPLL